MRTLTGEERPTLRGLSLDTLMRLRDQTPDDVTLDEFDVICDEIRCRTGKGVRRFVQGVMVVVGYRDYDGTSWMNWVLMPASVSEDDMWDIAFEAAGIEREGFSHFVPGQRVAHGAHVHFSRTRILITQYAGLDV